MREITEYEKSKWFDSIGRFDPPETVEEGSEWGTYMDVLAEITGMSSYGASDEFVKLAQVEYLDQYYDSFEFIYAGEWGDSPEDLGLPSLVDVYEKQVELEGSGIELDTAVRMAKDWAMQWKEESREVNEAERERKMLEQRLVWNANRLQRLNGGI